MKTWNTIVEPPVPKQERHELKIGGFTLVVFPNPAGFYFAHWKSRESADRGLGTNKLEEAKRLAAARLRSRLMRLVAEIDSQFPPEANRPGVSDLVGP